MARHSLTVWLEKIMDLKGRVGRLRREAATKHPEYYGALSLQYSMLEELERHVEGVRKKEVAKNLKERTEKRRKSSRQGKLDFSPKGQEDEG